MTDDQKARVIVASVETFAVLQAGLAAAAGLERARAERRSTGQEVDALIEWACAARGMVTDRGL